LVEISKCRRCAWCCCNCVFLDYDRITNLFNCLIYHNKNRTIVRLLDYKDRIKNVPLPKLEYDLGDGYKLFNDKIIQEILNTVNDENRDKPKQVCHNFTCGCIRLSRLDKRRLIKSTEKIMKNREKVIPNFNTLVEILNA